MISIDEWWEVVSDHSHSYLTTPAGELLARLAADTVALQQAIVEREIDEAEFDEIRRA